MSKDRPKRQNALGIKPMSMTKEETEGFKKTLEKERESIEERIKNINTSKDFGSDIDGGDEEADETEEFENIEEIKFVLKDKIKNIDRALEKIENGSYGICEECAKEIEPELLNISPESRLCKQCKQPTE